MLFPVAWHQEYVLSPAVRVAGLLLSRSRDEHQSQAGKRPAKRGTFGLARSRTPVARSLNHELHTLDHKVAVKDPLVTVLVPVAPTPEGGGAGTATKLNVPDTLEEVSVAMVSDPLPPRADAAQLPVGVVPFVVMTFSTVALVELMTVVPTAARAAKLIASVSAALLDAMFRFPAPLTLAALTTPV